MMGLGMQEVVIIGIIAILLFGKRLPEVAKSMGKSYKQFRQGLAEIQSTVDVSDSYRSRSYTPTRSRSSDDYDDYDEATAPKFEPPPSEPKIDSPE